MTIKRIIFALNRGLTVALMFAACAFAPWLLWVAIQWIEGFGRRVL